MRHRPNILVILTDQQTNDAVSAHGNPWLRTPHVDTLVRGGVSFRNAYCPAPVCGPARGSLLSGLLPHETGVEVNGPAVRPDLPTMGDHFRKEGYRPYYAGKLHLGPRYQQGIERRRGGDGFEFLSDEYPRGTPPQLGSDTDPLWTDSAVAFLNGQAGARGSSDQPFLLVTSLHNPHDICYWVMQRRHYLDLPEDAELPRLPDNFEPLAAEPEYIEQCRRRTEYGPEMSWTHSWDEEEWRTYLYAYYRLTERVDRQIGRVLQALEDQDLTRNTLVAFVSDHGEGVAAHRWVTKLMFWEEVARVPFALRWPGVVPAGRIDRGHLVSGLDLLPTLCDYAGIDAPARRHGQSLRPVIENPALPGRPCVVTQLQAFEDDDTRKGRMLRTARYKYVVFSHGQRPEMLFDLETDPGETENLAYAPAGRDLLLEHRAQLRREIEQTSDPFVFPSR